jgi:hypothetical protein
MKRLYDNELIYGRLLEISEPHLIDRYNTALKAFGFKPVKLEKFSIDQTGFSPEVAKFLGDELYLDPLEVNRRFIIVSPAQEELPVVHTAFSNTSQLMHEFFAGNRRAINALTIRDVIYGEIEDSVAEVRSIEDLLSIEDVQFKMQAGDGLLDKAAELRNLADRLTGEPDFWRDDASLNRMVELAKATGDIRENPLVPEQVVFRHDAYWTSHFGGLYVFLDEKLSTVICDPSAPGFRKSRPWQVSYIDKADFVAVFEFLANSGRLELPRDSWVTQSKYFEHRADMVVRSVIAKEAPQTDFAKIDSIWLQAWMNRNARAIEADGSYPFLVAARRAIAQTGRLSVKDIPLEHLFQCVRARPDHVDAWLTNRLISDYVPSDFVSMYVFNKEGFYDFYAAQADNYREHIVETLKALYLSDKAGLRARLYGL